MLTLELSEEQYKYLFVLLDKELKTNGLSSLVDVVNLHNTLLTVKKKEEAPSPSEAKE